MADLLVGIDVSRDTHHVAFTDGTATERWGRLTVPHDAGGGPPAGPRDSGAGHPPRVRHGAHRR